MDREDLQHEFDSDLEDIKRLLNASKTVRLEVGKHLRDKYLIQSIIERGGMGCVYKGVDTENHRPIAIKEIITLAGSHDQEMQERLTREYYFLSAIDHPSLIKAYDFFQEDNQLFLVLELAQGCSLKSLLKNSPPEQLSLSERLAIANQIARAVEIMHAGGIIHRDIKPANIMVNLQTKNVKLLDLGLAKSLKGELAPITQANTTLGTPGYLSPEQLEGHFCPEGDIFSLGVTLYQLFLWLDKSPFEASDQLSTMMNATTKELTPLIDRVDKKLPPVEQLAYRAISRIIDKTLQKNVEKRLRSAKELAEELEGIFYKMEKNPRIKGQTSTGWTLATALDRTQKKRIAELRHKYKELFKKEASFQPPKPPKSRHRKWPLVLALLIAIGFVPAAVWWQEVSQQISIPQQQDDTFIDSEIPTPDILWKIDFPEAISSDMAIAKGILYVGSQSGALYALDLQKRSWKWRFPSAGAIVSRPEVYQNTVYFGSCDRNLYSLDADTGRPYWRFPTPHLFLRSPTASGETVYFSGINSFYALHQKTAQLQWKIPTEQKWSSPAIISAGIVYFSNNFGSIYAVEATTGQQQWRFIPDSGGTNFTPAIRDQVLYMAGKRYLYALDITTRHILWKVLADIEVYSAPVVVDHSVYFAGHRYLYAVNAETGRVKWQFTPADEANHILAAPCVGEDIICIPYVDGIYAIARTDGRLLWKLDVKSPRSPIIEGEMFYCSDAENVIYAVRW